MVMVVVCPRREEGVDAGGQLVVEMPTLYHGEEEAGQWLTYKGHIYRFRAECTKMSDKLCYLSWILQQTT